MNNSSRFILTLIGISVMHFALGQNTCQFSTPMHTIPGDINRTHYRMYEGSAFLSDAWSVGNILLKNGETINDLSLKVDLYAEEVIYYNNRFKQPVTIEKDAIRELYLFDDETNAQYHIVHYAKESKDFNGFVFHVVEGKIPLYMKKSIKLNETFQSGNGSSRFQGVFYEKQKFYFRINAIFYELPKGKQKLAKLFPNHKKEIVDFISQKYLSLKNEQHVITLFKYINEL